MKFFGSERAVMNVERDLRHESFKQEMVPFMDMMYGYAVYLTGNREEASDLLQETFLKAFRFFDKFEPGTNAKAWLYRIMRNTYINEYRRTKRVPELVEYDEQVSSYQMLPSETRKPDEVEGEIFEDEIAVAIASLPEKFKSVIVLRDVEDLPYEEIAEALSIPIGTVRSRLHRARAILFDRLKKYAKDRGYTVGDRFVPHDFALAL
ncbi:MAG TPA: sigma-70 family RNA polymerase sigma factor [Bacteroidota bacterium]|nr:sigma-70 family RNA polymerase sigma factor [Bacteroidota bacterium]